MESAHHLLAYCRYIKRIWEYVEAWMAQPGLNLADWASTHNTLQWWTMVTTLSVTSKRTIFIPKHNLPQQFPYSLSQLVGPMMPRQFLLPSPESSVFVRSRAAFSCSPATSRPSTTGGTSTGSAATTWRASAEV
jgi:hypothetical protein